jgi:hypothetical protein
MCGTYEFKVESDDPNETDLEDMGAVHGDFYSLAFAYHVVKKSSYDALKVG